MEEEGGKRPKGRPHKRWINKVKNQIQKKGIVREEVWQKDTYLILLQLTRIKRKSNVNT